MQSPRRQTPIHLLDHVLSAETSTSAVEFLGEVPRLMYGVGEEAAETDQGPVRSRPTPFSPCQQVEGGRFSELPYHGRHDGPEWEVLVTHLQPPIHDLETAHPTSQLSKSSRRPRKAGTWAPWRGPTPRRSAGTDPPRLSGHGEHGPSARERGGRLPPPSRRSVAAGSYLGFSYARRSYSTRARSQTKGDQSAAP